MRRTLTPRSSLDNLKREAKRWLKALHAKNAAAIARLRFAHPGAPDQPILRDVQHALALEHGFGGWTELKAALRSGMTGDVTLTTNVLALLEAVDRGDTDRVAELLDAHPDIVSERGVLRGHGGQRTALHFAVGRNDERMVALLLDRGADLDATDSSGLTVLDQAALAGELEMATLLINAGAIVHLPAAVALGRKDDSERLLAAEPNALRPGGRLGTLIVRAAEQSSSHVMERLLRAGASANATVGTDTSIDSTCSYTALHAAAFHGNADAVSILIRNGANIRVRDSKYCGTPAGWANYKGHHAIRDFINSGAIDLFEAINGLAHRIPGIVAAEPDAIDKRFGEYADCPENKWIDPSFTPLMWAANQGDVESARLLLRHGANALLRDADGRMLLDIAKTEVRGEIAALLAETQMSVGHSDVADAFVMAACLDWRTNGSQRVRSMHDAARLLAHHPEITRHDIFTALAAGDVEEVRARLHSNPALATAPGGPRAWAPLVYLCSARLPLDTDALTMATLLLDNGADPNGYYFGGNPAIHYTALTCLLGRGEEQALPHPQAERLAALLVARGAEPYDMQVLYNVFADHASRKNLADDMVWLLELMYSRSLELGRAADWDDPDWTMLDMGGYRPGARYLLGAAVNSNLLRLAEWMLAHGASPNAPPPSNKNLSQQSLFELAVRNASPEMVALLVRFGAKETTIASDDHDVYVDAVMAADGAAARVMVSRHPEFLIDHRALFTAATRNRADAVTLLLDLGVSPNVGDPANAGQRALHAAAYAGSREAAQVLIDRGADVDSRNAAYHAIPLGLASWAQQQEMIELLGQYSRDIWELVYTGRVERIRALLADDPALAKTRNTDDETPLMWLPATEDAAVEITRMMLANGANGAARSKSGETAAAIAAARGMTRVVELLSEDTVTSPPR